ncbi:hypothetical protein [Pseudorhizobium flavum]|uniref:hypothetical protein n=1 Tax=Pseudorhizobium flavum TaxID=1335061 RepID=UPI002492F336|nr:hypothetical protein [Pseudorhizobium flavum]
MTLAAGTVALAISSKIRHSAYDRVEIIPMSKIIRFPLAQQPFASFGPSDDTQIFCAADDSSLTAKQLEYSEASTDWTNQELADLYRVEAILVQSNVKISSARGLSDQGDPWFAFCREDGEVFVHIARITGCYLLDSPRLSAPLTGNNFREIVERFVKNLAEHAPVGNVVQLRPTGGRDDVVRLHPAMMLAAIVWTIYIGSDDFVSSANAADAVSLSHDDDAAESSTGDRISGTLKDEKPSKATPPLSQSDRTSAGFTDSLKGWHAVEARGAFQSFLAMLTQSAAIGLPLLSLSHSADHDLLLEFGSGNRVEPMNFAAATSDQVVITAEGQHETALTHETGEQELSDNRASDAVKPASTQHVLSAETTVDDAHEAFQIPDRVAPVADQLPLIAVLSDSVTIEKDQKEDHFFSSSDIIVLASAIGKMQTYTFDGLSITTTVEKRSLGYVLEKVGLTDSTADPDVDEQVLPDLPGGGVDRYAEMDRSAQTFIRYFLLKVDNVELIQVGSHLIFVDVTAIDEETDHAYTISWSLGDGGIVSTVGHYQDFEGFGLA